MILFRVINKYRQLLTNEQKKKVFFLGIIMIFGGLLEIFSVSLMIPFMNLLLRSETIMNHWYIIAIDNILGLRSSQKILIFFSIILALIFLLKNSFLIFEYEKQYKFIYENMFKMQKELLINFINRPYEHFFNINSGEVFRIIHNDAQDVFLLLTTLLTLASELIVSSMLLITVFLVAPIPTTFITILLLFLLWIINYTVKPKIKKIALISQNSASGMYKWLIQSLHGIKELKVANQENYFINSYSSYGYSYVKAEKNSRTISMLPRFIIEAISMGTLFISIALFVLLGGVFENVLPVFSIIVLVAMRILPSINRISAALATISFTEPRLDKIIDNLNSLKINLSKVDNGENNKDFPLLKRDIILKSVSYHYPNTSIDILKKADLNIKCGESIGIIGASGAGKTTTVDIILGLLSPVSGQVLVDGCDIFYNKKAWLAQVGYIPQAIFLLDDTLRENVIFGNHGVVDDRKVWESLEEAALSDYVKSLADGLNTQIGERGIRLSGGQKQRIGIARALFRNPNVLVFDEATSALDVETENAILDSIRKLKGKKTMIIIAHRHSTVEACDHIYRVENGIIRKEK